MAYTNAILSPPAPHEKQCQRPSSRHAKAVGFEPPWIGHGPRRVRSFASMQSAPNNRSIGTSAATSRPGSGLVAAIVVTDWRGVVYAQEVFQCTHRNDGSAANFPSRDEFYGYVILNRARRHAQHVRCFADTNSQFLCWSRFHA
jgi:hypothetical protein